MAFLPEFEPRPLALAAPSGIEPRELFVGRGGMALEIAVCESRSQPAAAQLRELHRLRVGRRAAPVLARGNKAAVAVFLERPDLIDPPSPQFDGAA